MRQLSLALFVSLLSLILAHSAQALHVPASAQSPGAQQSTDAPALDDDNADDVVLHNAQQRAERRAGGRASIRGRAIGRGSGGPQRQGRAPMLRYPAIMKRLHMMQQFRGRNQHAGPQRDGRFGNAPSQRGPMRGQPPHAQDVQKGGPQSCPHCGHDLDDAPPKRDGERGDRQRSRRPGPGRRSALRSDDAG